MSGCRCAGCGGRRWAAWSYLLARAVLLFPVVKAAIWLVALFSGTSGGALAPLLILGAAGWLAGLLPGTPGFWVTLTGTLFAVELTGNPPMLPALLAAIAAAYGGVTLLLRHSMLTEKITRRGQHITREYGVDPFELTRMGEVMVQKVDTVPLGLALAEAVWVLGAGRHRACPAVDKADPPLPVVLPGDMASHAVDVMLATGHGRLPVTDPQTGALMSLLTRKELLQARAAMTRAEGERSAFLRPFKGRPA